MCFAVNSVDGDRAQAILRKKFANAIAAGRIQDVDVEKKCAVLAAVGQRMAANKGVAAKFFTALATAGVNIKAMAQGSSEYNITVLVKQVLPPVLAQAVRVIVGCAGGTAARSACLLHRRHVTGGHHQGAEGCARAILPLGDDAQCRSRWPGPRRRRTAGPVEGTVLQAARALPP